MVQNLHKFLVLHTETFLFSLAYCCSNELQVCDVVVVLCIRCSEYSIVLKLDKDSNMQVCEGILCHSNLWSGLSFKQLYQHDAEKSC